MWGSPRAGGRPLLTFMKKRARTVLHIAPRGCYNPLAQDPGFPGLLYFWGLYQQLLIKVCTNRGCLLIVSSGGSCSLDPGGSGGLFRDPGIGVFIHNDVNIVWNNCSSISARPALNR